MSKNVVNNLLNISLFCQVTLSWGALNLRDFNKSPLGDLGVSVLNEPFWFPTCKLLMLQKPHLPVLDKFLMTEIDNRCHNRIPCTQFNLFYKSVPHIPHHLLT